MPLSPKTTQIQSITSQVKEGLEKRCFWHLTQHGHWFPMIKYQLLKIYSQSAAGPQSFPNFLTQLLSKKTLP
jgi:hypothetical protein